MMQQRRSSVDSEPDDDKDNEKDKDKEVQHTGWATKTWQNLSISSPINDRFSKFFH